MQTMRSLLRLGLLVPLLATSLSVCASEVQHQVIQVSFSGLDAAVGPVKTGTGSTFDARAVALSAMRAVYGMRAICT